MAAKTQLSPVALPGRRYSFSAKDLGAYIPTVGEIAKARVFTDVAMARVFTDIAKPRVFTDIADPKYKA